MSLWAYTYTSVSAAEIQVQLIEIQSVHAYIIITFDLRKNCEMHAKKQSKGFLCLSLERYELGFLVSLFLLLFIYVSLRKS